MNKLPSLMILLGGLLLFNTACDRLERPNAEVEEFSSTNFASNPGVTPVSDDGLGTAVMGQLVYVPVYSEIYEVRKDLAFQLTATVSLRNTDPDHAIVLKTIDYYNSTGEKVHRFLEQPIQLDPLVSVEVVIGRSSTAGGLGANFLVELEATETVSEPMMESVMISTRSQQGISFTSPGRVIKSWKTNGSNDPE